MVMWLAGCAVLWVVDAGESGVVVVVMVGVDVVAQVVKL